MEYADTLKKITVIARKAALLNIIFVENNAGSTGDQAKEPTTVTGARTDTDTNGGDYLH